MINFNKWNLHSSECPLNKYGKGCTQDCSCSINTKSCDNVNGTCTCNIGWEGLQCDADVDECSTNSHNCTDINGICVNIDGSFMCDCKEGFTFNGSNVCTSKNIVSNNLYYWRISFWHWPECIICNSFWV